MEATSTPSMVKVNHLTEELGAVENLKVELEDLEVEAAYMPMWEDKSNQAPTADTEFGESLQKQTDTLMTISII